MKRASCLETKCAISTLAMVPASCDCNKQLRVIYIGGPGQCSHQFGWHASLLTQAPYVPSLLNHNNDICHSDVPRPLTTDNHSILWKPSLTLQPIRVIHVNSKRLLKATSVTTAPPFTQVVPTVQSTNRLTCSLACAGMSYYIKLSFILFYCSLGLLILATLLIYTLFFACARAVF